jgi:hypothetical protein
LRAQPEGYVNVDGYAGCQPDQVVDLESTPWPFPTGVAEEIVLHHVIEHLGHDPRAIGIMLRVRKSQDGA